MKNRITHIDLLSEHYEKTDVGTHWSRHAQKTLKYVLNDLCSLRSDDYVGMFRIDSDKRNQPQRIYFFDKRERLIFVCDKENDYQREDIEEPDHYIRSIIGVDRFKL